MKYTRKRAGAKAVARLLVLLVTSGGSYAQLVAASGLSQPAISAWIRELRNAKPTRLVFIGAWQADPRGYLTVPVFHWGPFPDVSRPSKPAAQRVAEYKVRKAQMQAAEQRVAEFKGQQGEAA